MRPTLLATSSRGAGTERPRRFDEVIPTPNVHERADEPAADELAEPYEEKKKCR